MLFELIALGGFAGVVVFAVLFNIVALKGGPWKIPAIGMGACFLVVAAIGALLFLGIVGKDDAAADGSPEPSASANADESVPPSSEEPQESIEPPALPMQTPDAAGTSSPEVPASAETETMGQKNAAEKAKQYLAVMAFSHSGLIDQLEFEGYTAEEAAYGADRCGADWNEQAAKKAQEYLDTMAFSRQGLIDQLKHDGFTQEEAEYGVTKAGY